MAGVPAGQPISPGIAVATSGYPQYGVMQSGTAYTVKEAASASAKQSLEDQGYLTWFTTDAAAKAFVSSETSALNGDLPSPLAGLAQIGTFFSALGDTNTWIRVGKVVIGGLLLIVGLVHITGAENAVAAAARKVPLPV